MSAAVSIYIYHHTPSNQSRLYRVTQLRTDGVHCRESVVSEHNHCCTAAVHTVDPFPPPDLCLYKRKEFSVHGTISCYVSKHTSSYYFRTVDPFPLRGLMPAQRVKSKMNTVQYHPLSKHCRRCTTAVHTMDRSPPPRFMLVNV